MSITEPESVGVALATSGIVVSILVFTRLLWMSRGPWWRPMVLVLSVEALEWSIWVLLRLSGGSST